VDVIREACAACAGGPAQSKIDDAIAHLSELPALIDKWSEADSTP